MPFGPFSMVPRSLWTIAREMARHVLRHPVVGVVAAARDDAGRWLLIRRADTGTWALPGGTLEWGETLRSALEREVAEESGARVLRIGRLVGVYSRPNRDPRFHAVTVVVEALVDGSRLGPSNPLEIREARMFDDASLPSEWAMGADEFLRDAREGDAAVFE